MPIIKQLQTQDRDLAKNLSVYGFAIQTSLLLDICNKHFKNFLVSSWVKLLTVIVNISLLISLGQNALYTYSYLILPMIL